LFIAVVALGQGGADEATRLILKPQFGPAPRINGPKVYGARPGHPFLYRTRCTGVRPIRFSAEGLPPSLRLGESTRIISGDVPERRGEYAITLHASNKKGKSSPQFKLVVGDTLALTPPMGWNGWYTYYTRITDKVIREGADDDAGTGRL
jgi:alpha-galactosidase